MRNWLTCIDLVQVISAEYPYDSQVSSPLKIPHTRLSTRFSTTYGFVDPPAGLLANGAGSSRDATAAICGGPSLCLAPVFEPPVLGGCEFFLSFLTTGSGLVAAGSLLSKKCVALFIQDGPFRELGGVLLFVGVSVEGFQTPS
jgi:hypothetical protein